MMNLQELKLHRELCENIDWDMTPENAVRLYLEWGNNWASGNYVIKSDKDVTRYFVVNSWKDEPVIYLIERNNDEAKELAKISIPKDILSKYYELNGNLKGVFALDKVIKKWLKKELN